jgi:RNA polymerase sigma factor (sigma-70 family)
MHPTSPGDSWRTWLMTGSRGTGVDHRRVQGAHRGLKKILVEGMTNGGERARPWKDFSGAMVRQAVNEALNQLPPDHKEVVKLAYFGGLSNREIARNLGLSVGGVQRRLRLALARVSEHVEHGRAAGRRAFMALLGLLAARRLLHAFKLATVTVAVSVIALPPAPPTAQTPSRPPAAVVATNETQHHSTPVVVKTPGQVALPAAPDVTSVVPALPVKVPALPAPPVPAIPRLPKLPQLPKLP